MDSRGEGGANSSIVLTIRGVVARRVGEIISVGASLGQGELTADGKLERVSNVGLGSGGGECSPIVWKSR